MKFVIAEPDLWSLCLYMCTQTNFIPISHLKKQRTCNGQKVAPSMARETPRAAQRGPGAPIRPWAPLSPQ